MARSHTYLTAQKKTDKLTACPLTDLPFSKFDLIPHRKYRHCEER